MSRNPRHPCQAAVIDVGSHAVRMDIFEAGAEGHPVLLESLSRPVDLGREVFHRGAVSPEGMSLLSRIMASFRDKLDEYRITDVRAIATSALREAFNGELVTDRLRYLTGIDIEILESTQEIRLVYLEMRAELAKRIDFGTLHGITVVIGAGSLFAAYFEHGLMRFCEELPTGTDRLPESGGESGGGISGQIASRLRAAGLRRRLCECVEFAADTPVTLFPLGEAARAVAGMLGCAPKDAWDIREAPPEQAWQLVRLLALEPVRALAERLGISREEAENIIAAAGVFNYFLESFNCERLCFPGVTTRSAVIGELVRKNREPERASFDADLAAICRAIGRRYSCDAGHAESTALLADALWCKLRSHHALPERSRALLGAAARLHDVGRFIDSRRHHRHSHYIISNLQIPGMIGEELKIVAATAFYHRKSDPDAAHREFGELAPESRVTVLKLAAILKAADALDCSRRNRFANMKLNISGNELIVTPRTAETDIERAALAQKSGLFSRVFGLNIRIGEVEL